MASPDQVTQLLHAFSEGKKEALDDLFPLVYDELQRVARYQLRNQRRGQTLNTVGLVHEAYFKLVNKNGIAWENRAHFLGVAARAMRQILVDFARKRTAQKRGADIPKVPLEDHDILPMQEAEELVALDEALAQLGKMSPRQAQVVEFRYFGGLTIEETAAALDISAGTVKRDWKIARAWLAREVKRSLQE